MTLDEYCARLQHSAANLMDDFRAQQEALDRAAAFIRLMEPYINAQEAHYEQLTASMREIVDAYKRAKGEKNNA